MDSEGKYVSKKTLSEMMTDILFPTYQPVPEPNKPSMSISTSSETLFVGTEMYSENTLKDRIQTDKGKILYNNVESNINYAGEGTKSVSVDKCSFGDVMSEGIYTITYNVKFADGEDLKTNKGVVIPNSKYTSDEPITKKGYIYCVYPVYITSGKNITEYVTYKLNYHNGETITDIIIPKETTSNKFEIHVPVGVDNVKVFQLNPTKSNVYDIEHIFIKKDGFVKHVHSVNGNEYETDYNVFVRTLDEKNILGSDKYKITIKK